MDIDEAGLGLKGFASLEIKMCLRPKSHTTKGRAWDELSKSPPAPRGCFGSRP
ncbi:uncharacterized protein G2W53_016153 [Senna tora]|uniref:Uncharacterized protein n=1 Tax=Senna tora TaxID=362788 RepID=A0A835C8W0_9FABA|nr:uncharacterized protein G2W53_016153 [Senna tora]